MHIKVLIPDRNRDRKTLDSREFMLSPALSSDSAISVDNIKSGPDDTDTYTDEVFAAPDMIKQAIKAEKEDYDAIVIYCFNDIAIDAIRENVSIPVIGPGETSIAVANMLFNRFFVVTTLSTMIPSLYRHLMKNNIARDKMTSIRALDIPLSDLRLNPAATESRLLEVCRDTVTEEKVEGAILGCLGMATYGRNIEKILPITVLDPAFISIAYAEMCARLNLKHSIYSYPPFVNVNKLDIN